MTDRICPDCTGKLDKIKLIGDGWQNPLSGIAIQTELQFYAGEDTERGLLSGQFKAAGMVEAFICSDCSRIFMYGTARKDA